MIAAERRDADDELGLARVAAGAERIPARRRAAPAPPRSPGRRRCRCRMRVGRELDRLVVAEVAGHRDDGVRRPVRRPPEVADRLRGQCPDPGLVAADLAARAAPSPNIACWKRIWAYSAGSSRYERISSTITARSPSISSSSSVGRTISSPRTSIARVASRRGTRTQ